MHEDRHHRGSTDREGALPLLASKLVGPSAPAVLLPRPRLFRLLDAGVCGPVTLVATPAGWGKTVLLSSWARVQEPDRPVAWLSIETGDDGVRFWAYLQATLVSWAVRSNLDPAAIPAPPTAPGESYAVRLADSLARLPQPVVVVLDDLHRVADPDVFDGLDFVLRHAGERLRVVVGTRTEPPLALHRWRLSGGLTDVWATDLAFTPDETASLLAHHGVPATAAQIDALQLRTEGWPAGLRLAARSLRVHPDPDRFIDEFGGDHPSVAGYLVDDVLGGQPAEARDVLLRTSIVERISGDLVDALTGRSDAERILADLDRTNAFVVPLDTRPPSYRYHRMFGELLRAELRRHAPEEVIHLHRRAAAWHAAHDLPADALRHALAGQDWDCATSVLVRHWPELVPYGPRHVASAPSPPPPPDAVRADPELALAYAAELLDMRYLDTADNYLRLAHQHRDRLTADRQARLSLMAAAFGLAKAQVSGDRTQVLPAARHLLGLAQATGTAGDVPAADVGSRAIALTAIGVAELDAGDLVAAEAALTDGLGEARRAGLSRPRLTCSSRLALLHAVRGELRQAERVARSALGMPAYRGQSSVDRGCAHLALAIVALQRDQLDEAEANLGPATTPAETGHGPALVALAAIVRAQVLQARGDPAASYQALTAASGDLSEQPPARPVARWLATVEADLRTAQGDCGTARKILLPILDDAADATGTAAVALARTYLRDGDPHAAARTLPEWNGTGAARPLAVRVDAGVLEAMIARRLGDHRRATRTLEAVLRLAEPEGLRRVFTRAGAEARDLLANHLDAGTAHWALVTELVAAADRGQPGGESPPPFASSDSLTDRELTVLRYLQSMLSNVEIARELSLSVNTVKTHVRNIYRKLDATRRREAVRRGRELRLL